MFVEEEKIHAINLYFKYGKSLPLLYANRATLRKEICGVGSAHGKPVWRSKRIHSSKAPLLRCAKTGCR